MKPRHGRFGLSKTCSPLNRLANHYVPGRFLLVVALACTSPLVGVAQAPIGWRTDGTGAYPKAQPPLKWSTTKNVVWSTPMPGYGVSHPVLLGQFVFTCAEPGTLLCLKRDDGKMVWQKTC